MSPADFIARWTASDASEASNAQLFLAELCDLLEVGRPDPAQADTKRNDYVFERRVDFQDGERQRGLIDLYKKDCFVLEAKQGAHPHAPTEAEQLGVYEPKLSRGTAPRDRRAWADAMTAAKNQAYRYARALGDGWPPFLLVVDVGYCIDVYADFARQGKAYQAFPTQRRYRIGLEDLEDPDTRAFLRTLWTDPLSLDPARKATRVTRGIADRLATVAQSLEADGHDPGDVAGFLMRTIFTMFAEDVGLLPEAAFMNLLDRCRGRAEVFPQAVRGLWETMDAGGFDPAAMSDIEQFNGFLYKDPEALPISDAQLELLIEAAEADWTDVEPAIFGTLLERALDPKERHRLGAHFTPRAYVERLVIPAVIEPLKDEWTAAQTAASRREADGDEAGAREEIVQFHRRLCTVRVLDPACGSGNFLYVTLEHLKRLEAEVLEKLSGYAGQQTLDMTGGYRVSPEQLLGLEVNPRATRIANVVLWIGYLQWHFRTFGDATQLDPPILKDTGTIRTQDAVLAYDERVPRTDADGTPVTRWDRRTYKTDPTTGERIPDSDAQKPVYDYTNPRPADWPEADFIVGNPPFIGSKRMMDVLGEGYTEAVREAYLRRVPKSADFVMFWWYKAAKAVRGKLENWKNPADRFGFVSTNSIRQAFNRKVVEKQMQAKPPLSLVFGIPDHPWVISKNGADVRISMTVGAVSEQLGTLQTVRDEPASDKDHRDVDLNSRRGNILPDLTIGADVVGAEALVSNEDLAHVGVQLNGSGFLVNEEKANRLKFGADADVGKRLRDYWSGRDLVNGQPRDKKVIDLYDLEIEAVRNKYPAIYQHIRDHVKPERDQTRRKKIRELWWIHGWERPDMREAVRDLDRYISTVETSKHRFFVFLDDGDLVNNTIVVIALQDAFHLGVLSSRIHVTWALAAGGRLGVGNDPRYSKTQCFDPFPFPAVSEGETKGRIRSLAESLDAHRKQVLSEHDALTMTDLYNVLEKERAGEALGADERTIHEQGMVGVLRELHDDLDAAVADAYGWDVGLSEDRILEKLVQLNATRRAEEEQGQVRYLRPAYQAPEEYQPAFDLDIDVDLPGDAAQPMPWPAEMKDRARRVRLVVDQAGRPLTVEEVAQHFHRARRTDVRGLLETLDALGLVEETGDGAYAA